MEVPLPINITTVMLSMFEWIGDVLAVFTAEPAIYFVGVALVGAVAGVARKFVPMRKR